MKTELTSNYAVFFRARRHFIIGSPLLGVLGSLCIHHLSPAFIMVFQSPRHLSRGLVERSLVRLGGASLHALSVA